MRNISTSAHWMKTQIINTRLKTQQYAGDQAADHRDAPDQACADHRGQDPGVDI